jgi:hypothetical protein
MWVPARCVGAAQRSRAIAQKKNAPAKANPLPAETQMKNKINEWTLGLAGGLLEGAPIRLATEIAQCGQ